MILSVELAVAERPAKTGRQRKFPAGGELAGNWASLAKIWAEKVLDSRILRKNSLRRLGDTDAIRPEALGSGHNPSGADRPSKMAPLSMPYRAAFPRRAGGRIAPAFEMCECLAGAGSGVRKQRAAVAQDPYPAP